MGRGASDLTATLLGELFDAEAVEIWSDVDGVLSGPPSWIPEARTLGRLGYTVAADLARGGSDDAGGDDGGADSSGGEEDTDGPQLFDEDIAAQIRLLAPADAPKPHHDEGQARRYRHGNNSHQ